MQTIFWNADGVKYIRFLHLPWPVASRAPEMAPIEEQQEGAGDG
jgi:hypothetical protein